MSEKNQAAEDATKEAAEALGRMRAELIAQGFTPEQAYELVKLSMGHSVRLW
ncbi:hypothetical protein ACIBAI_05710 [Streptomyces sp. NPDC051041]|uniref:hypothetical protein n=1 Tax=Streptomyces sp. NPDC051041 TaxID=3365640 RepID=UPI00379323A6